jgi:hypothetical protein
VDEAWKSIPGDMVQRSFKKCGISNDMDGEEGSILYDDDSPSDEDEADPYDDTVTARQQAELAALFDSDDDDTDFDGFSDAD